MSNPAVVTLASIETELGNFRVEDNLGEAIHLHLNDFRYDLSIKEFMTLAMNVNNVMLDYTSEIPGFDINKFSKEFLLQISDFLPDLVEVKEDNIFLESLLIDTYNVFGCPVIKSLPHSRVLKALNGDLSENNRRREQNYFNQSNQQRVCEMLESIKENGYPQNGERIVLFNKQNIIADGQHRASCLYYLYGNINVPVYRMIFKEGKHDLDMKPICKWLLVWDVKRIKRVVRKTCHKMKNSMYLFKKLLTDICVKIDRIKGGK
ncbi:MAG: hypothetical protein LUG93_14600 [Lachnospiraceae bacterium]|nr:hypothetical protein [Lachnospiraceae bacterium]